MMKHSLFAILALLSVASALTAIEGIELNDYVVRNNWELVQKSLNQQRVIRLCKETLSEESLNRILSLQLPAIEELHFFDDEEFKREGYRSSMLVLTQTLVRTIFTSSYFPRISVLNLGWTNIDDRALSFLEGTKIRTTLKELNLRLCLIGKEGFRYLSNIQFSDLKVLNLQDTLLKEDQAVDSLISIICGEEAGRCVNNLQDLNIAKTNIQRDNFIRLMRQINSQPLQRLDISYLSLIYNGTYNDGFVYSAFQSLTAFGNLRTLVMKSCDVDDTAAAMLANWTLPFLTSLNLHDNHLSEKGLIAWVTKLNMPSLAHLNLNKNAVGDEAIFHFASEDFQFESLRLILAKFTAHGMEKLNHMDLRMLKVLQIGFNMPTKILNSFIEGDDFPNLQELVIKQNDLFLNPFAKINWKKLSKLRALTIQAVNLRTSVEDLVQNTLPVIPSLKKLTLENTQLTEFYCIAFLTTIKTAFPNLQHIVVRQLQEVVIYPDILMQLQLREGLVIEIDTNILVKKRNAFQVICLTNPEYIFMDSNDQEMTEQAIENRIPTIALLYDFMSMEVLGFEDLQIAIDFFKVLKEDHITSLPRLREFAFFFKLPYETMLDLLADIEMPNLRVVIFEIIVPSDASEEDIQQALYPFFRRFPLLQGLYLTVSFLSEERGEWQRKMFMDSLYYPFLADVQMYGMNMELEEIASFIKSHNQTLRLINFGSNFMEKGFLQLLVDSQYSLLALSLEATSFTVEEFAILGRANTEFMSTLILSQNDLTNEHVFAMLRQKEGRPLFPKLTLLDLTGNDIRKEGLQALLQSQLLLLDELHISENSNPEYVNLLFSYPTKISSLQALDVDVYGVKKDLNSMAARSLSELYLKTKSFIGQDFANLAKLQFSELRIGVFQIHNVYDCQTLRNVLEMTKDGLLLIFDFHNDMKGLNSSCLKASEFQSHTCCLNIYDNSGTTYLPEFVLSLLNTDSSLKEVMLIDTKFPPEFFRKVFTQSSFGQLQILSLLNNYVGDEAFRIFLNADLSNLEYLFAINADITDSSIEGLSLAKLPALKQLALSNNRLSKRAMESLRKLKAEKLKGLYLANCGLKADSLDIISTLRMEQLVVLDLSHNDFQEEQALQLVSDLQRKNLPSLAYVAMEGIALSKANYDAVAQILRAKSIQFAIDAPHNLHRGNSAKY